MHDWRESEALWRYGVIRDAVDERLTSGQRGLVVRELAGGMHEHPGGQRRELSRLTVDRWVRAYRVGGFDALKPGQREGVPRTAAVLLEQAVALRHEQPARTGAQIARILARVHGPGAPSARTVERHLARVGVSRQVAAGAPRVFGRFEADSPNELWTADALHGPVCVGPADRPVKAICFAIPRRPLAPDRRRKVRRGRDDAGPGGCAARRPTGPRHPQAPLRRQRRSVRVGAAGSRLRGPGHPADALHARAAAGPRQDRRFFRTLRSQFLVELGDEPQRLEDLNALLTAWIERVYHHATHSQTGEPPIERFAAHQPRHATPDELREAFLWAEQRTVAKTATVSLHANTYEVDPVLTGRTVQLLFDPFDLDRVEVRHNGRSFGEARARQIGRHSTRARRPNPQTSQPSRRGSTTSR